MSNAREFSTNWIQTFSGERFNIFDPQPERIHIIDIAHALSNLCRFGGHTRRYYSVAEHSVHVAESLPPGLALSGLLHDASEAYLVDLPSPIKRAEGLELYSAAEEMIQAAICEKFHLPYPLPSQVKTHDLAALVAEAEALMAPLHSSWDHCTANGWPALPMEIMCLTPETAKNVFLLTFLEAAPAELVDLTAPELVDFSFRPAAICAERGGK